MKRCHASLLAAALGIVTCSGIRAQAPCAAEPATPRAKSALLIGIDTYVHPSTEIKVSDGTPHTGRYEPELSYPDLKGPKNDVAAMREVLTGEKFGFPNDDKHIHVLLDKDATHDAILRAMQQYLVTDPKPCDTVVLFISSHGSVRVDPKGHGQLYDLDGTGRNRTYLENTIVPYDWYLGVDDVFSRDIRHIFNQAASRGIQVTAIFDSCHSGSLARGAARSGLVARDFDYDPRPMPPDPHPAETTGTPPENRADNPVLVLSAAQKDQSAIDVQTADPPHGLFTQALIETLQALPAGRPADDVFRRLQIAMELTPGTVNQQPQLDTSVSRRKRPIFGGEPGSGPATAAVVSADGTSAVLDIGIVADVGPGSEFTELAGAGGATAVLRISDSVGLARSKAVISPAGAAVHAKDIVKLTKWVPAARPTLNFYAGAANLPRADIEEALAVVRASGVKLAGDPSADTWTHHIYWDGAKWTLRAHASKTSAGRVQVEKTVSMGAKVSPGDLKKLPAAGTVWFEVPLPRESLKALLPSPPADARPSAAVLNSDRDRAVYVVGGAATGAGIQYAWFKRSDLDGDVQTPKGMGAGCSPSSPYPIRTDWVTGSSPEIALTDSAVQLARLNGWLQIQSSLTGQSDFPYQLVVRSVPDNHDIVDGGATYPGSYELDLAARVRATIEPRWVYVLEIDCEGKGTLLWPTDGAPPGKFPGDKGRMDRIPLPDSKFAVQDPFGSDTYLLLTTSSPLTDPWALEFTGVVTRSAKAASPQPKDPLEDLLDSASAGTRAVSRPTPTNWSVQTVHTQSGPQPAAGGKQ